MITYFLFGLRWLTLYSFFQSCIQFLLKFSWSCSGTGSGCCFSHSLYTCWHFDQNMGKRPFNAPPTLINHSNIGCLTSGTLHFLPPPLSRNLFLEGSSSTNSSFKYFPWHLFANFKASLRLLLSCAIVLNHYKTLKQLLQETLAWFLLGRVFFAYNHNEFSLAGLLSLYHNLSCIFQSNLQVRFFLPNYTSLSLMNVFPISVFNSYFST